MSYDPAKRSTRELLADWAAIMRQLRARDVIRTNNNPIGDIAEAIVAAHYHGERGSFILPLGNPPTGDGKSSKAQRERKPRGRECQGGDKRRGAGASISFRHEHLARHRPA